MRSRNFTSPAPPVALGLDPVQPQRGPRVEVCGLTSLNAHSSAAARRSRCTYHSRVSPAPAAVSRSRDRSRPRVITWMPAVASARPAPSLGCAGAPTGGTVQGGVCVLPFGVTASPNAYSVTIAIVGTGGHGPDHLVHRRGQPAARPDHAHPSPRPAPPSPETRPRPGRSTSPSRRRRRPTSTPATRSPITVQGPPDQLVCDPPSTAASWKRDLRAARRRHRPALPGDLVTSHQAGGTLSVVSGALPPG